MLRLARALFGALPQHEAHARAVVAAADLGVDAEVRLGMIELSRRVAGDFIVNEAKESTRFLESLRAVQTIKAGGS